MIVYVNGESVAIFEGARVIDAARAYASMKGNRLDCTLVRVRDSRGNELGWDGELTSGAWLQLTLQEKSH